MKYLHIIVNTAYTAPYINLITNNFGCQDHVFYVIRGWSAQKVQIPLQKNVRVINSPQNIINGLRLLRDLNTSEKIFIHGLFSPYLLLMLCFQPWLLKKSNWVIWGGDLHQFSTKKGTLKSRLEEVLRKICIRRFSELTTIIRGDYELAKKWYGAKGRHVRAMYPTPLKAKKIDEIIHSAPSQKDIDFVSVQIGNSATPSNNHFEILDLLKKYQHCNIRVYVLLSYGMNDYADKVIAYGRSIFQEKFIPVTEYMKFEDFVHFMNQMDIVILNHRRQQALGNILLAAYLKKKIFLNEESTLWVLFRNDLQIQIESTAEIENISFESFTDRVNDVLEASKKKVEQIIDEKYVVELWNSLFDK